MRSANPDRRPALAWVLGTFLIYALLTWGRQTGWNSHTLMADAILHGRWDLHPPYGSTELITTDDGRKLVAYGVGPSLLMLPWVALLGPTAPQSTFCALIGALGVGAWFLFLGASGVQGVRRHAFTAMLALGSPHFFNSAYRGDNWLITHACAVSAVMASLWLARTGRSGWAGMALGMAALCRPTSLAALPLLAVVVAEGARPVPAWRQGEAVLPVPDQDRFKVWWAGMADPRKVPAYAWFGLTLSLMLLVQAWANWDRFGSPLDNGYRAILLKDPISNFGQIATHSWDHVRHHLPLYFLSGPVQIPSFPWWSPGFNGLSIFITMPFLVLLVHGPWRSWKFRIAIIGVLVTQAFYLSFIGTGAAQFGMRYATDWMPLVFAALALRPMIHFDRWHQAVLGFGMFIQIWGITAWRLTGL
ncbi:MAG: hypothetical protein VKO21_03065 [Candidatus Sericytochromatia bacterium]|nr:hypothetical protein [Candidatus Sericytochromatia bacterium]